MHLLLTYYKQRKREFLWSRPWPVTMRRDGRRVEALLLSSAHLIVLSVLINVSRKPLALQMLRFVRSRGYNRVYAAECAVVLRIFISNDAFGLNSKNRMTSPPKKASFTYGKGIPATSAL